jgi:thymidylate kinase
VTLHPLLAALFDHWETAEVVWALLRAPVNSALPEGDVDILLERRTARAAKRIALSLGFVLIPRSGADLHLVHFDRETGAWLWLHCTTELAYGPGGRLRPGLENRWLAARRGDGVKRLAPEDEFWLTLMHALLDKGRVSDRNRVRLTASVAGVTAESPLARAFDPLLPPAWTAGVLLDRVRAGDWVALERVAPGMRDVVRRFPRPLGVRLTEGAAHAIGAMRGLRRRRGVTVALLGPDGAGKSTLAAGIERSFVLPVRQVYMGLTGGWLRQVDKLRMPGVVQLARFFIIWSRYLRGVYHAHRGRLVVFDRYIYDAEVPTPDPLTQWRRLTRWLDGRSCPGPDVVLVLDAPGAVMYDRKGQYSAEMLEDWRQCFRRLQTRRPNVEVLDTTLPPDAVLSRATALIWQRYEARWRRR